MLLGSAYMPLMFIIPSASLGQNCKTIKIAYTQREHNGEMTSHVPAGFSLSKITVIVFCISFFNMITGWDRRSRKSRREMSDF